MKTDRELLELAAKAAGLKIDKSPYNGGGVGNTGFDCLGNAVLDWHNMVRWNPRVDDGDALRLETKLLFSAVEWADGIEVGELETVYRGLRFIAGRSAYVKFDECGGDKRAARRLAGVRAAAEIGESMP